MWSMVSTILLLMGNTANYFFIRLITVKNISLEPRDCQQSNKVCNIEMVEELESYFNFSDGKVKSNRL